MIRLAGATRWHGLILAILLAGGCAAPSPRSDVAINTGWRFAREDVAGAEAVGLDDSQWQPVDLPHSWNALDGADGGNNYYRGAGWYRRAILIAPADLGKRFFLRFEGACLVTSVHVNGKPAGEHRGGFGAFCFDVTDLVHAGENVIAVRVDNSRNPDVPPLSGDFTMYGGLYRNVHLLTLPPVHISPLDDASPGVYLKQAHVDRKSATVQITTKLRNTTERAAMVRIFCWVHDASGALAVRGTTREEIAAYSTSDATLEVRIPHPHLWDGTRDAHLYRVTIEARQGEQILDRIEQPLGLRYFKVDPQTGFSLNGKPYKLRGVNVHQETADRGWAITGPDHERDYKLIREMGCTLVRMAHYQHSEYEYSLCDRIGMAVWAELALVNRIGPSPEFAENAKQQLRELIKQNYNHPSILFWSLYNEPNFGRERIPERWALIGELNELAHELDPTRLTTGAVSIENDHPANWIMDVTGINRYWGWYSGSKDQWGEGLDDIRRAAGDRHSVAISEYGAGASIYDHENNPTTAPIHVGWWHPEEWQASMHESVDRAIAARPWIWGQMMWVMFDFGSDGRKEGFRRGINDKGVVTRDRLTRKDAFYYYKANWTTEPLVHITSRRFNPRPPGAAVLKVYSNCDSVELFLDGKSLGSKSGDHCVFTWPNVDLNNGRHEVRAEGSKGFWRYSDKVEWIVSADAPTTRRATGETFP